MNAKIIFLTTTFLTASAAWSSDGVVLIDQNRAVAGNVTPGDTPGFPITISVAGSYQLSGNLNVPDGINGIEITVNDVTLNLNGFAIAGPTPPVLVPSAAPAQPKTSGVLVTGRNNVAVLNGTVLHMGAGINFVSISSARVERLRIFANDFAGILLSGFGTISNSTVSGNNQGIVIDSSDFRLETNMASLRDNEITTNRGIGVSFTCPGVLLSGNTILRNHPDISAPGNGCMVVNSLVGSVLKEQ